MCRGPRGVGPLSVFYLRPPGGVLHEFQQLRPVYLSALRLLMHRTAQCDEVAIFKPKIRPFFQWDNVVDFQVLVDNLTVGQAVHAEIVITRPDCFPLLSPCIGISEPFRLPCPLLPPLGPFGTCIAHRVNPSAVLAASFHLYPPKTKSRHAKALQP